MGQAACFKLFASWKRRLEDEISRACISGVSVRSWTHPNTHNHSDCRFNTGGPQRV